jgi:hypothetical protein
MINTIGFPIIYSSLYPRSRSNREFDPTGHIPDPGPPEKLCGDRDGGEEGIRSGEQGPDSPG